METKIITQLDVKQLQEIQAKMNSQILIIKFGADWCGPCKKIAPNYVDFIKTAPANIIFADIDIDESIDLYISLKRNKMVTGIPVFFAYYGGVKRDKWFIPDDSIIGGDIKLVTEFFERCTKKALELVAGNKSEGYSYFS